MMLTEDISTPHFYHQMQLQPAYALNWLEKIIFKTKAMYCCDIGCCMYLIFLSAVEAGEVESKYIHMAFWSHSNLGNFAQFIHRC